MEGDPDEADKAAATTDITDVADPEAIRQRNVYVAELPVSFTHDHFRALLEQFGPVASLRLFNDTRRVRSSGRAYGFCLFELAADASAAVAGLDGLMIESRPIEVRLSNNAVIQAPPPKQQAPLPASTNKPRSAPATNPRVKSTTSDRPVASQRHTRTLRHSPASALAPPYAPPAPLPPPTAWPGVPSGWGAPYVGQATALHAQHYQHQHQHHHAHFHHHQHQPHPYSVSVPPQPMAYAALPPTLQLPAHAPPQAVAYPPTTLAVQVGPLSAHDDHTTTAAPTPGFSLPQPPLPPGA